MLKETVFKSFETGELLASQLADRIAAQLQDAVDVRGQASLVVSGGTTPLQLFHKLSEIAIDWQQVFITLADDRWLEPGHPDSNERLAKEHLLQRRAASAKFRGLKNMFATAAEGAALSSENLANIPIPFDVVVLGMGNDGHTCSWFPCSASLKRVLESQSLCEAVTPTTAPYERITLTKQTVLTSRQIYLHLSGHQKLEVYHQALESDDVMAMPIRAVLGQYKIPVDVYWSP